MHMQQQVTELNMASNITCMTHTIMTIIVHVIMHICDVFPGLPLPAVNTAFMPLACAQSVCLLDLLTSTDMLLESFLPTPAAQCRRKLDLQTSWMLAHYR